jgi:hypothetical protein
MSHVEHRSFPSASDGPSPPISRKQFLQRGAAVAGGIAAYGLVGSSSAFAASATDSEHDRPHRSGDPRPIPGGLGADFAPTTTNPLIHAFLPAVGFDVSTITDFKGVVAATEVQGTASGSDGSSYWFDNDMRFMRGVYIDVDGRLREHSFGFV